MDFNYLDELYNSSKLEDIKKFYESVDSVEELVEFSRRRPKAEVKFFKRNFDNEKNVIAVIPTADSGKFSDFFDGKIPEVLVESNGPYFNYSHSLNLGVREALKYNPEWVIICNDDLFEVDRVEKMLGEINKNKGKDFLLAKPGYYNRVWYHSIPTQLIERGSIDYQTYKLTGLVDSNLREMLRITDKFNVKRFVYAVFPTHESMFRMWWRLIFLSSFRKPAFYNIGDFSIIRSETFKKVKFNELFINFYEDALFSYQLKSFDGGFIDYRIGSFIGKTLGKVKGGVKIRKWRNAFIGTVIFDYLLGEEG
jgi:hypothetical protein